MENPWKMELAKEERGLLMYRLLCRKEIFLTLAFCLNV